jgi:hypothetical protein
MPSDLIGGYLTLDLNKLIKWADFRLDALLADTMLTKVYIERSIEFVIKVGAGTEAVGLFESINLFVYKLMLQNAISGVKRRARLCLKQNGEHFQHLL